MASCISSSSSLLVRAKEFSLAKQRKQPGRAPKTVAYKSKAACCSNAANEEPSSRAVARRTLLLSTALALVAPSAHAVQGFTAGRIPGVVDIGDGYIKYTRPEGKSGGHGVGWSELDPYSFVVPEGWEEKPVSIADLGGTEIDLRFTSKGQGNIQVVLAPVLRFASSADKKLEEYPPEQLISAFTPELVGAPLEEGMVKSTETFKRGGRSYYLWQLDINQKAPHNYVVATIASARLYLLHIYANGREWKKYQPELRKIADSFTIVA
eukprot:jgi/Mesvir1/27184/Mv07762-RA.1